MGDRLVYWVQRELGSISLTRASSAVYCATVTPGVIDLKREGIARSFARIAPWTNFIAERNRPDRTKLAARLLDFQLNLLRHRLRQLCPLINEAEIGIFTHAAGRDFAHVAPVFDQPLTDRRAARKQPFSPSSEPAR